MCDFCLLFIIFGIVQLRKNTLDIMKNILNAISLRTLNGCIFLGTTIGRVSHLNWLIYVTAVFVIYTLVHLVCRKYHLGTYVYTFLMLLYYFLTLYYVLDI